MASDYPGQAMPSDSDATDGPPPVPGLHPALSAFQQAFPDNSIGEEWAKSATTTVQVFLNEKAIADHAAAGADHLVNSIDGFKASLIDLAHNDPTMTPLALALVPNAIANIVAATPLDDPASHAAAFTQHIQSEIARAGVQSYAMKDETVARRALDRYGEHLGDDDRATLDAFIGTMAAARGADAEAQAADQARAAMVASDVGAHNWLGQLADPRTGDVAFPPNWTRNMVADPTIQPETKAALWNAHERFRTTGNPSYSDPDLVTDLVNRIAGTGAPPTPGEVYGYAGDRLTLADTQHLAAASFPQPPEVRAHFTQLADTIARARSAIAPPENGIAGLQAFGRFVDFLMPAARNGAILDPYNKDYVLANGRLQQFIPTPGEVIAQSLPRPAAERPSLADIFGQTATRTADWLSENLAGSPPIDRNWRRRL